MTVAVDDTKMQQLPCALGLRVKRRKRSREAVGRRPDVVSQLSLVAVSQKRALQLLRKHSEPLQLQQFFEILYQLRHGGVTRDAAFKLRDTAAIWRRGNWKHLSSVKAYEKQGRLASARLPVRKDLLARYAETKNRVWDRLLLS